MTDLGQEQPLTAGRLQVGLKIIVVKLDVGQHMCPYMKFDDPRVVRLPLGCQGSRDAE